MVKDNFSEHRASDQLYRRIGEIINNLRVATGVSQQELATVLELHQTAVCRVENGTQRLTPVQLQSLAGFFGISIDSLFSGRIPFSAVSKKFGRTLAVPESYAGHPFSKLRDAYPLLDFLTLQLGQSKVHSLLASLKIPRELLLYPDTALGAEFQLDLFRIALSNGTLNQKTFPKLIAQTRSEKLHGSMHPIYETLLSPLPLLQTLIFNMHRYETNFKYNIEELDEKKLVISVKPELHMQEVPYREDVLSDWLCRYKKSYFSNFPQFIGEKPLMIREEECHFKDSHQCVYSIQAS